MRWSEWFIIDLHICICLRFWLISRDSYSFFVMLLIFLWAIIDFHWCLSVSHRNKRIYILVIDFHRFFQDCHWFCRCSVTFVEFHRFRQISLIIGPGCPAVVGCGIMCRRKATECTFLCFATTTWASSIPFFAKNTSQHLWYNLQEFQYNWKMNWVNIDYSQSLTTWIFVSRNIIEYLKLPWMSSSICGSLGPPVRI